MTAALRTKHVDDFAVDVEGAKLANLGTIDRTSVRVDVLTVERHPAYDGGGASDVVRSSVLKLRRLF